MKRSHRVIIDAIRAGATCWAPTRSRKRSAILCHADRTRTYSSVRRSTLTEMVDAGLLSEDREANDLTWTVNQTTTATALEIDVLRSVANDCTSVDCTGGCNLGWSESWMGASLSAAHRLASKGLLESANGVARGKTAFHVSALGRAYLAQKPARTFDTMAANSSGQ